MPIDILMPALSPTMEKGSLVHWVKAVGDRVASGDLLAEIETDKATMDVESTVDGILARIVVPAGTQDVAVNEVIGLIALDGEPLQAEPPVATAPGPTNGAHVPAAEPAAQPATEPGRIFASPIARRLMKEAGLDAAALAGTGPRGRILERDVKAALAELERAAAAQAAQSAAPAEPVVSTGEKPTPVAPTPAAVPAPLPVARSDDARVKSMFEAGSFEEVPHDSMRLTIARRLLESKQTVPHFYVTADCALDALLALRIQLNDGAPAGADGRPRYRLSVNDFIVKALALALREVPDANVSFTEAALLRHRYSDIGVAVAIPGGLITPIVRRAETKSLSAISAEVKDFAARAKARRLKPEEYLGGTSSVSNLGTYGVREFSAIINPPQATILAVGAGEQRVVARSGAPAVVTMMTATLSVDHRAVDGATAAELLAAFKANIEQPMAMLA